LLSGGLDDGVSGLWEIERRGGVAVVQHPEEAAFPSMPLNALKEIEVDHTVRTEEMATLLTRLVTEPGLKREVEEQPGKREMEARVVDLTCPECRGTIWEVPRENGEIKEFRCRVGHVYSPRTMFAEQAIAQEKALWSAIVALEEGASLAERLAGTLDSSQRQSLLDESRHRQAEADRLRKVLEERKSFTLE
jgi:two-component system chemotaxis response regulator CheB